MSWQQKLKEKRFKDSYSQQELSEKIGVSRANYALWESGRITPSPKNRRKVAEYIGEPVQELFEKNKRPRRK